jgi:hypothetical protein
VPGELGRCARQPQRGVGSVAAGTGGGGRHARSVRGRVRESLEEVVRGCDAVAVMVARDRYRAIDLAVAGVGAHAGVGKWAARDQP